MRWRSKNEPATAAEDGGDDERENVYPPSAAAATLMINCLGSRLEEEDEEEETREKNEGEECDLQQPVSASAAEVVEANKKTRGRRRRSSCSSSEFHNKKVQISCTRPRRKIPHDAQVKCLIAAREFKLPPNREQEEQNQVPSQLELGAIVSSSLNHHLTRTQDDDHDASDRTRATEEDQDDDEAAEVLRISKQKNIEIVNPCESKRNNNPNSQYLLEAQLQSQSQQQHLQMSAKPFSSSKLVASSSICTSLLLNLFIFNTIFSHLINITAPHFGSTTIIQDTTQLSAAAAERFAARLSILPNILLAEALLIECALDGDCENREKTCHENKCICPRNRPIEDQDRCLPLALLNEPCSLTEQCLGNSFCVDGTCSCGSESISMLNPNAKIYYCHPKRRVNEECNFDPQCPTNSYCSMDKYGCLCQNGYAPSLISNSGVESVECLPKTCSNSSFCESEFHECDDNKCKCLATHFDPTTAKCYKFGSKGGKIDDEQDKGNLTATKILSEDNNVYSILKDLTENGDKIWLVLIVLISLSLILFLLIFLLIRKHYLGFCWRANKKEYEPNNKNPPKNGYFNKNSINNKSFRQKNNQEVDEEGGLDDREGTTADEDVAISSSAKSNLVNNSSNNSNNINHREATTTMTTGGLIVDENNDYVKVNINDSMVDHKLNNSSLSGQFNDNIGKQYYPFQKIMSSTSTPV